MFSFICSRINDWVNNREAGDLRRHRAHYDVTVMPLSLSGRLTILRIHSGYDFLDFTNWLVVIFQRIDFVFLSFCFSMWWLGAMTVYRHRWRTVYYWYDACFVFSSCPFNDMLPWRWAIIKSPVPDERFRRIWVNLMTNNTPEYRHSLYKTHPGTILKI